MTTFSLILILAAVALASVVMSVVFYRKMKRIRITNQNLRAVVDNQSDYTFLLNSGFEVQETNFYVHRRPAAGEPDVLGNVLHCRNAHEAGRCGEAAACLTCPVRFVIRRSFERKSDFDSLEACMELNGPDGKVVDLDVQVEGHYVSVNQEDRMVVNVKDVTKELGVGNPKVLFISEDVQLFDRVRTALKGQFRVLSADNLHQALHRLLLASDYQFYAILTDEEFYRQNDAVTKILVKNNHIPVFVFTSNESGLESESNFHMLRSDIPSQELLTTLLNPQLVQG
jgi:hypothetical protein